LISQAYLSIYQNLAPVSSGITLDHFGGHFTAPAAPFITHHLTPAMGISSL